MSVLESIVDGVLADLAVRRERVPLEELRERAAAAPAALDGVRALRADAEVRVIAEVKRASPSAGLLADIPDAAAMARAYQDGGAAAVSVLTEERRFGGGLADLDAVRAHVRIPVLRKDFVVTRYQVWEARAHGADLVLLIAAALDGPRLPALVAEARAAGLTPLVEVHDAEEIARAVDAGAEVIGVNNRDLRTLRVDRSTFARLVDRMPHTVVRVAESGIRGPEDVAACAAAGADAVLVGTALVRGGRPAEAVRALAAACLP
ncbi:indole-3-glycerol phosphate synthase TrpC [Streptomyces sp. TRM68367]|uniref:indole-3-glycerol phosphate synthase TrpC n=1 Tax=Streptomyces sp. TRM68367 TaxID=2758415 RepID=UPI00165A9CFD|nr:indole-3-glycerol phosphate synthase TrpC [Streptomyces sp. TRM68367]MBC9727092.1 indole-3-glycerol phosphate synthase TrpC [Streptomyces sp. TRM68367]